MSILKYGKYLFSLLLLLNLLAVVSADAASALGSGICSIVNTVKFLLLGVMFAMIVGAAVVYAGGQIMGAETRARASVWATAMFTGAVIAAVVYILVPAFITAVLTTDVNTVCGGGSLVATLK